MGNSEDFLMHWGIRGMKWGQRLYQNKDGTLTPLGRKHYGTGNKLEKLSLEDIAKTTQKLKVINDYRSQIAAYKKFKKENSFISKLTNKFSDKTVDLVVNNYEKGINNLIGAAGKMADGVTGMVDYAFKEATSSGRSSNGGSNSRTDPKAAKRQRRHDGSRTAADAGIDGSWLYRHRTGQDW